jgi:hypothetical protein
MVMQACRWTRAAHPGVQPGAPAAARRGEQSVRAVLERIDAIEALGIAPAAASPAYWRTLANRLAARLPLPEYTAERHAAWLAEGAACTMTGRILARACALASCWRACPPAASLRWPGRPSCIRCRA